MAQQSIHDTGWYKSSYSGGGNDSCVEVRVTDRDARVRDSKNRAAGTLRLPRTAFSSLIDEIR